MSKIFSKMSLFSKLKNVADPVANPIRCIYRSVLSDKSLSLKEREVFEHKLELLLSQEVNILVVGGTGVGKSSTINSLFRDASTPLTPKQQAKVGTGPDPETQIISHYSLGNLIIWDTPGLGESPAADNLHIRAILKKMKERSPEGAFLIDFILVIFDGSVKDYGATFNLVNILAPQLSDKKRIVVGVNKIDLVRGGRGWDYKKNQPTQDLKKLIDSKVESVKQRIHNASKIDTDPIPYCAGYADDLGSSEPYNVSQLLCAILDAIDPEKRLAVINQTKEENLNRATESQKNHIKNATNETFQRSGFSSTLIRVGLAAITGGLFGGCFITSAVCRHVGKSDNCHILYLFRKFRDGWLKKQVDGQKLINEYYSVAPGIVNWIESQPNHSEIYADIYNEYLIKCYKMIKHKRYKQCKLLYIKMVLGLQALANEKHVSG